MTTFFVFLPAALSALVLAAHFMRRGSPLLMLASLALLVVLGLRTPWARRLAQGALLLGGLEWMRSLFVIAEARNARGEPWERMAIILASVAVLAWVSASLLETRIARRRFAVPPETGM